MIECSVHKYSVWVSSFGDSLTSTSKTNLEQLRVLEASLESLQSVAGMGDALVRTVGTVADSITNGDPAHPIDPEGEVVSKFEFAEQLIADIVGHLRHGNSAIVNGQKTQSDASQALLTAFGEAIEVYARLFSLVEDLRWAIKEHDADLSPIVGTYKNVDDLIASLK